MIYVSLESICLPNDWHVMNNSSVLGYAMAVHDKYLAENNNVTSHGNNVL